MYLSIAEYTHSKSRSGTCTVLNNVATCTIEQSHLAITALILCSDHEEGVRVTNNDQPQCVLGETTHPVAHPVFSTSLGTTPGPTALLREYYPFGLLNPYIKPNACCGLKRVILHDRAISHIFTSNLPDFPYIYIKEITASRVDVEMWSANNLRQRYTFWALTK